MKSSLIINGLDITPYIAKDGLNIERVSRNTKSVVVKNGDLYQTEAEKIRITVNLLDMSDDQFRSLIVKNRTYLSTISYSDYYTGLTGSNRSFYFYKPKITARKCIDSITYLTGITLELEEK